MINLTIICKSNHWPARLKKVNKLIKEVIKFKKNLKFNINYNYNCNIILTDNKLIKQMNYKFRKKKYPTDVLTFVSTIENDMNKKYKICDIFISAEIIKKDALLNKISFYDHLTHIIIHSFLHINGLIHNKIKDFNKMKKIEVLVLKKLKIKNPYIVN